MAIKYLAKKKHLSIPSVVEIHYFTMAFEQITICHDASMSPTRGGKIDVTVPLDIPLISLFVGHDMRCLFRLLTCVWFPPAHDLD